MLAKLSVALLLALLFVALVLVFIDASLERKEDADDDDLDPPGGERGAA